MRDQKSLVEKITLITTNGYTQSRGTRQLTSFHHALPNCLYCYCSVCGSYHLQYFSENGWSPSTCNTAREPPSCSKQGEQRASASRRGQGGDRSGEVCMYNFRD